ncbi:MAG TPA: hypothetical protein VIJ92_04615 [Ginsengibacter sp.]
MKKIHAIFQEIINCRSWHLIFLLCMFANNSLSQNAVSVIQQQFETYSKSNYQEKVFLHTDKTVYTTGEVIWFKVYITDAASNKFSLLSKICYVEIITADKKNLLQGKIDIDSGKGNGSFQIPSSIRTGNYIIRAYTNWMKNFDSQFYFEQTISIINPNKGPENIKTNSNAATGYIQFFPEGGNLVYDLQNTVAYKITDVFGKGLPASGYILTEKNDTAARFETEHFGMGTFSFTPAKGNKYHAIVKLNNSTLIKDLPEIYNNGWVMHLKDEGNTLAVDISCNIETEHNIFLFAHTRHSVKVAKMQLLSNGNTVFTISKSELGEGISQLTVFNEEKQPVCERLYFKKPIDVLPIKLGNINATYDPRKKVNINVSTGETNGIDINADMSVAVYLADSLQPEQKTNLLNYLWLTSELKGAIESPAYYFENAGTEVDKATDNLMLTQGWRRFKWEEVLADKKPSFTFLPEYEGHIITGKISPKTGSLPDTGITVYLSVTGKNFRFSNTTSSTNGLIQFNVEKFYGSRQVIAQTNAADSNYRVFIDNPFSEQYADMDVEPVHITPSLTNNILLRSIGAQVQEIYQPEKENNFALPVSFDTTAFYGKPSKQYYLDAYTRFPTMEEVMREYVKEVHVKKKDKNFRYEVFNEPYLNYFNDDPLVLMDGVPVFNVDKVINMDPLKIQKVDVVTAKFFKGNQHYDGIVSYGTYNGDLDSYQLDPNSLVVEYDGLQLHREFYSPQYETDQQLLNRKPDYRNVLYWSPEVTTKNGKRDISFYTSDVPGKYIVLIQGISDTGIAGFATATFTVTSK